jgi:hypothetical protein
LGAGKKREFSFEIFRSVFVIRNFAETVNLASIRPPANIGAGNNAVDTICRRTCATLRELIAKYHASAACQIAEVYAFRNQSDEAFKWLDRAYGQGDDDLIVTKVDPLLKNLHNDPRYVAFLKQLHLPN